LLLLHENDVLTEIKMKINKQATQVIIKKYLL
jgi:hypothetical protein